MQGPDFPTGGFIYGKSGIAQAYTDGRGRFMMRAKAAIESMTKEKQAIIVTEIPYQVNKSRLIERIAELVNEKMIDDIGDVRDESDRDGMRIVIELKRGAQPEIILNQLYKHTQMQESFSHDLPGRRQRTAEGMGLDRGDQALHRSPHGRCAASHGLPAAQGREREHILEGYKIALDNLDAVIKHHPRQSGSRAEARENLYALEPRSTMLVIKTMAALHRRGFAASSAADKLDAILELQLYRLTRLSVDEISERARARFARTSPSTNPSCQRQEAARRDRRGTRRRPQAIRRRDERRTQILDEAAEIQTGRPDRRRASRRHCQPLRAT